MNCWCHPQFCAILPSVSNSGAYNFNLTQHTHLCGNFDQNIAVPTNMLKGFQSSCGRQHRQQPLLHNSKLLFSWHKCVFSSAGGKWGWNVDAVRICRYEHKEIWHICLLITHTFFQCPARHLNSLCICCKGTAVQSSEGDGKLWQGKRKPRGLYTLCWKPHITSREYISLEKPVFNIGLMPLLLENAHATALLSRVMNLFKEAVEHLNPNQTPVLTMDQPLSAIAKEIQYTWLWSDSFCNHKYVIMTGGWCVGSTCWVGPESGWMVLGGQVQSQLLERCCRIVCESILCCEDKICPPVYSCSAAYSLAECLPFLCAVWASSCCQLRTVSDALCD